jgi:carboxymethylenebutenolidase
MQLRYGSLIAVAVILIIGVAVLAIGPSVFSRAQRDYREQLEAATTHGEWVRVAGAGGDTVVGYLAYPERPDPAPGVIVIHEIFGLTDWVRTVVDDFAARGYVAIAPDLLSRRGGTPSPDEARRLISELPRDSVWVDLDATFEYLRSLPAVRGEAIGVIGFCWGGRRSFGYAAQNPRLRAAVVCYGSTPGPEALSRIEAPVLGVYAENDARINEEIPQTVAAMRDLEKRYEYAVYPGTGHGFLRRGEPAGQVERGWTDIFAFLQETLWW